MLTTRIIFSSYTLIGLALLILSASAAAYLAHLDQKSRSTVALIGFLFMISLSGTATILANSLFEINRIFLPWQDFWILAGGVFLIIFAYNFAGESMSREGRIMLVIMGGFAAAALGYCVLFAYRYLTQWTAALNISDSFYLLLPLGTMFTVIVMLRRSLYFSARAKAPAAPPSAPSTTQSLLHPQGAEACTLRNLALALSLAFLPGLQTLIGLPSLYGYFLSNVGSILAIIAITFVYFNYAPEINSFMAKLVGITLAFVILIFTVFGTFDIYISQRDYGVHLNEMLATIEEAVRETGSAVAAPAPVAYIVSWDAVEPQNATDFKLIYFSGQDRDLQVEQLLASNEAGRLETWTEPWSGPQTSEDAGAWRLIRRDLVMTTSDSGEQYIGHIFFEEGRAYEIGVLQTSGEVFLSPLIFNWLLVMIASSALILLVFPQLFKNLLVEPLQNLLEGIQRVNEGNLDTTVPVRFRDEIGYLTHSFNELTQTVEASQARQNELFSELQDSYAELEDRVTERTRELAAFTDLSMLSGDQDSLADIVQPVLSRIIELDLCQALALHRLAEEGEALELIAQRQLPSHHARAMDQLRLPEGFATYVQMADEPLLLKTNVDSNPLPKALRIPALPAYMGCALMAGDQSHGWLSCYRAEGESFTKGERSLLMALARQIGVIVENQELRQRLKETAVTLERQRLGRDLHDSVTQLLFSMTLFTRSAQEAVEDGDQERLQSSLDQLGESALLALREMRFLLFELQPPAIQENGLAKALDLRLDMVERRVGIQAELSVDETVPHDRAWEQELYYVVVEALNNALKHAQADRVAVTLVRENGHGRLVIADNGCGFDMDRVSLGMGLNSMQQRIKGLGGELRIDSSLNSGTKVTAKVPMS